MLLSSCQKNTFYAYLLQQFFNPCLISIWAFVSFMLSSNNQQTEVFDHDRGTNGTFQLHVEGDQNIFEVIKICQKWTNYTNFYMTCTKIKIFHRCVKNVDIFYAWSQVGCCNFKEIPFAVFGLFLFNRKTLWAVLCNYFSYKKI